MGGGMARRLLSMGFPVSVYNRTRDKAIKLADAGAFVANSPREAAARSEMVIAMVADDAASRGIWFGDDGALAGAVPGSLLLESSTLSVGWVKELCAAAEAEKVRVSGRTRDGNEASRRKRRVVLYGRWVGCGFSRAREVLSVLGREVLHLGPTGSGALIKLINNFVCGVEAAAFAEAMALANAGGLDREKCTAVLGNSALASPLIKRMLTSMGANDFTPNFPLKLMTKDIAYAIKEAEHLRRSAADCRACAGSFQTRSRQGAGRAGFLCRCKSSGKRVTSPSSHQVRRTNDIDCRGKPNRKCSVPFETFTHSGDVSNWSCPSFCNCSY